MKNLKFINVSGNDFFVLAKRTVGQLST